MIVCSLLDVIGFLNIIEAIYRLRRKSENLKKTNKMQCSTYFIAVDVR